MDRGMEFLRSQVSNAVMQHQTFLDSLEDHEREAEDAHIQQLCAKYIPIMRQHQQMLEQYQQEIGADAGVGKKVLGKVLGVGKDLADATRESDFLRLVSDIVMARQSEDTFKTFREAGRTLGNTRLQQIGETGEEHHDDFVKDANRLVQQMFVEHVRGTDAAESMRAGAEPRPAV